MSAFLVRTVDDVVTVLSRGHRRRDTADPAHRGVDLLAHALQAAHEAYLVRPADEELQLAALVHDIGSLLVVDRSPADEEFDHALLGATSIEALLGPRVALLVGLHVRATRFLAATDETFRQSLGPDSLAALAIHGGPMDPTEIRAFERAEGFVDALVLASVDELAREPGRIVPSLLTWRPVMESVSAAAARERARPTHPD